MILALLTVALAQTLDLTTFVVMVARRSPAAETNPLVAHLFATVGIPGLLFGKAAVVLLVGALGLLVVGHTVRGRRAAIVVAPMAVAILAGLIGGWTNAMAYLG